MNFRKCLNFSIVLGIIALTMSCGGIKKTTTATTKPDEQVKTESTPTIKEPALKTESAAALKTKPPKVRPAIDPSLAAKNLDEINKYIDDLSMWTYVERVIAPYENIDEAINQDSIKILHKIIANYTGKNNANEGDALRFKNAIEFLLNKKADVDLLNGDGEDALCAFLNTGSNSSRTLSTWNKRQKHHSAEDLEPIIKLFIENGANIKAKNKSGISAFESIVDFAGIDFVKSLLENDIEMSTALNAAIKRNHFELLQYALENGAVLNTDTEDGKELFMLAAANVNDLELFKKLVDKTTDINAVIVTKSQQRRNALHELILGLSQQKTQKIYLDKAILLLDKGIKVIEKDWMKQNEENSLIVIVLANSGLTYDKSEVLCKKLIENGANINFTANMQSPLFILLYRNFRQNIEPLFELFLAKGADVNYVFRGTQTPLDLMTPLLNAQREESRNKALKISEILKSKGAKAFAELEK